MKNKSKQKTDEALASRRLKLLSLFSTHKTIFEENDIDKEFIYNCSDEEVSNTFDLIEDDLYDYDRQ